jgi:hypothetical protein
MAIQCPGVDQVPLAVSIVETSCIASELDVCSLQQRGKLLVVIAVSCVKRACFSGMEKEEKDEGKARRKRRGDAVACSESVRFVR